MVEWTQFWKDISEAAQEVKDIRNGEEIIVADIGSALTAIAIFYKQNRETILRPKMADENVDPNAPTTKQKALAKQLKIDVSQDTTKAELSDLISEALKK